METLTMASGPHMVDLPAMRLAGLAEDYPLERFGPRLPLQWARLMGASPIAGQTSEVGYGVRLRIDYRRDLIRYVAAVEVAPGAPVAAGLVALDLPPARYAVLDGFDHVADLRAAWPRDAAASGAAIAFERYGEGFDPLLGRGDMSLWLPVDDRDAPPLSAA